MELSDNERDYLGSQPLGRLATIGPDGSPQVRPVGFFVNEDLGTIDIGGHSLGRSQKFHNIQREPRVAFVIDDLASTNPWSPRGIEFRGDAEAITDAQPPGPGYSGELIRIRPTRVLSWGLDSNAFAPPLARNPDQHRPALTSTDQH